MTDIETAEDDATLVSSGSAVRDGGVSLLRQLRAGKNGRFCHPKAGHVAGNKR